MLHTTLIVLAAAVAAAAAAPDPAVAGRYTLLGEAPIAAAHAMQLPCGHDSFLLMEFGPTGMEGRLMLPHPSSNPDGAKVLYVSAAAYVGSKFSHVWEHAASLMGCQLHCIWGACAGGGGRWDRETNEWEPIFTPINSICGGWAKLPNGNVGMFAGHYQTLWYKQVFGMNRVVVYDTTAHRVTVKANLTAQRWYPTALTLPDGSTWVPGGTWAQKPNGTWPKAQGADIFNYAENRVQKAPLNKRLWDASIGNWYMGSLVLPSGKVATMNMNMMQVIDPYSGDAVAEAPPLTGPVQHLVWEFPRMGPQVMLRIPLQLPGGPVRFEFAVFGGSFMDPALRADIAKCGPTTCDRESGEQRPCSDYAVRIGLTVHPDGRHAFDPAWQVERMPGPRCIFDGVLLPNGHVVLLGGQRRGIGDLTNATHYNGGNEPWNEPWIYNPYAPLGSRFSIPGAKTKIARLYHAVAQLTSRGDILATGTSNAAFWESSDSAAFERTSLGVNEYRQEVYTPPYLFRAGRPEHATPLPPAWVAYGSTFTVGYSGAANITGVAWVEPGGTTHNHAIGHRSQLLPFQVESVAPDGAPGGLLSVQAPAAPAHAPPGFYLVFLLSGDLYSEGLWVQVREPAPKPLAGVVPAAWRLVPELSSSFEPADAAAGTAVFTVDEASEVDGVSAAPGVSEAGGTGTGGLRLALAQGKAAGVARAATGAAQLAGGRNCTLMLWARGSARGQTLAASVVSAADGKPLLVPAPLRLGGGDGARHCLFTLGPFAPKAGGGYKVVLEAALAAGTPHVDVDDIAVHCAP